MDITKLSLPELKALAYDLIEEKERAEGNLSVVNRQIAVLRQEENTDTEEVQTPEKTTEKK